MRLPDFCYTYATHWNWRGYALVWGTVALLLGGLIGGLFASGVISGKDFACPKGQHAYVEYYQPIVVSTGKSTVVSMVPILGCEK